MKDDESDLHLLKNQIRKLNLELDKKNQEINGYLEKIHDNEEELMELHELISKIPSQENIQKIIESKFSFELKEKEREIRDLKNRMGFLRQEKITFQRELEEFKKRSRSSAISIEEIREKEKYINKLLNLETVINDLRKKLYRQEILIKTLKKDIGEKEEQIKNLNLNVKELKQELRIKDSILEGSVNKKIKRELNIGLQKELDKCKKQIDDLKNKLVKYKKPEREKITTDIEIVELKNEIKQLNSTILELNQEITIKNSILEGRVDKTIIKELNKGLQKKLDKSKKQIDDLKNELVEYKKPEREKITIDIEIIDLKNKIIFLEKELESKDRIISELKSQK